MDSLVGYGSEDEVEERYGSHHNSGGGSHSAGGGSRRREDDTNYDDVNMDMSEDSQAGESEPELPQAEPAPPRHSYRHERNSSADSRDRERDRGADREKVRDRDGDRRRRETPPKVRRDKERDRRDAKRDDKYRSERSDRSRGSSGSRDAASKRGLLGDRPDDKPDTKVPALMDLKPFGGELPPSLEQRRSHDARDAVSPRFSERDRRDRERDRDHRQARHSEEKRSGQRYPERDRERSRSRGAPSAPLTHATIPPHSSGSIERRSPTSDYRPSYKVNKKLEVMEKMGLQIKTPDGSMATAQQLRAAASDAVPTQGNRPNFFNHGAGSHRILDQVQKRKLLWSNKAKNEQEEAGKWSGTRFAQDNDGKQVSKFMRLMGIKEPAAVKPEATVETADPIKKQEELFQAMQAQYEVARATTHTMRGVGLGFQRGQY